MGNLTSECGVQQGDPLGPLLFSLVLNILVAEIASDAGCAHLLYRAWYMDDGVVPISCGTWMMSGFCKLAHLARATPPSLSLKALELFDIDVRNCLSQSSSADMTDLSWKQAQLSLSRAHAVEIFNSCVAPSETISLDSILTSPLGQKALSLKLDDLQFHPYSACPPWLIGRAYYPPLPLILHHGFQLSPQKVLTSTLNQINTMLLSDGGLA
ncbi:hypothetical protein EMCRGX_G022455 [Ephydatia muelleri]